MDRQSVFQCVFCGIKTNDFRLHVKHLEEHSKDMYKCYACSKQFDNARLLRKHVATHINQCPLCSRTFKSLLVLANHVNNAHSAALTEEQKRCLYCDAAFSNFDELSTHSKEGHQHYFCDICYAGVISEPLLVEHHVNDHPKGRPGEPSKCAPSTPKETPKVVITKVVDPELEKVMEVIRTPELNPFVDKWHPALCQTRWDSKNKIECEVCHRYLKSIKLRVDHVKHFHPVVAYDCRFCPDLVFYALQDLVNHCQKLHFICNHCDSVQKSKETLQAHISRKHQQSPAPQPAQAAVTSLPAGTDTPDDTVRGTTDPDTSTTSKVNIRPARTGLTCGICKAQCPTNASFRIHLTTHKKTLCPFCPQKFFNATSRNAHIREKHQDRRNRQLNCRIAPDCQEKFTSLKELGIHSGSNTSQHSHGGALTKTALIVLKLLQVCFSMAKPMVRNCGMRHPHLLAKGSGTSAPSTGRHLISM